MIIDLSKWNEYIADDVPPGPIPSDIEIETMQIAAALCKKIVNSNGTPAGLVPDIGSLKVRFFWRLKE